MAVVAAAGSLATAASLFYLARQTNIANHIAIVGAHDRLTDLALSVDTMFIDRPELRKYFYNGESHFDLPSDEQTRVVAAAEFLCDFMENALIHEESRGSKVIGNWGEYCRQLLRDSAVIREFLHINRTWYDDRLIVMLDEIERYRGKALLARSGDVEILELSSVERDTEDVIRQADRIYNISFPSFERMDSDKLFRAQDEGRRILIARRAEQVLGFACILPIPETESVLLEYLAVTPDARSGGLGTLLLRQAGLLTQDSGATRMFLELEDPDTPSSSADAARRVSFYERNSCQQVEWLENYVIPDFTRPERQVAMLLYVWELGAEPVNYDPHHTLGALYKSAYGDAGQMHLQGLLDRIAT